MTNHSHEAVPLFGPERGESPSTRGSPNIRKLSPEKDAQLTQFIQSHMRLFNQFPSFPALEAFCARQGIGEPPVSTDE